MAISSITPISSSLILAGDAISFTIDDTYTAMEIKVQTSGPLEKAYDVTLGGAQSGYTFNVVDNGLTHTFNFTRDAGWDKNPTTITIIEDESGSSETTTLTYTLSQEVTFPQSKAPYNPNYSGTLRVTEDDVLKEDATGWMDFESTGFEVTSLGNGKVLVENTAMASGTDPDAIHDNVANEISAITEKTSFADDDILVIEDSAAGFVKKKIKKSNLGISSASTLEDVINAAIPDNDVIIPFGSEIVFRDNGVNNLTPLSIERTATEVGIDDPALRITTPTDGNPIEIFDSDTGLPTRIRTREIVGPGKSYAIRGGDNSDGTPGVMLVQGTDSTTVSTTAGNLLLNGGYGKGITSPGGDVIVRGGLGNTAADGDIVIGDIITEAVRIGGSGVDLILTDDTGSVGALGEVLTSDGIKQTFQAVASDETALALDGDTSTQQELNAGWDGSTLENSSVVVSSSGSQWTCTFEQSGGGDVRFRFGGTTYTLDCTPAASVNLTAGTATVPQINYIYVVESGGVLTLTASTAGFVDGSARIATAFCQDTTSGATDGAFKVHAWTDHVISGEPTGHIADINTKLRALPATWVEGVAPSDLVVSSPDAYISTTSGTVLQLHDHAMPARDLQTGDAAWLVNDPTTPYKKITTFDDITQDAAGGSINNRYFSLILWGAVNEVAADCKLFINLPSGTYSSASAAEADASGFSNFAIPSEFTGVGFLIAQYIVQGKTSGAWVQESKVDLRGLLAVSSPGVGTGNGDVVGPTAADLNEVVVYANTTGKEIGRSDFLLSNSTVADGTRSLGATSAMAGGVITTDGTIDASGKGAIALGGCQEDSTGTATVQSTGEGSIAIGYCRTTLGGSSTVEATALGSLALGYCAEAAGTSVLSAAGIGSFATGNANQGDIICTLAAQGGFAGGRSESGGLIQTADKGALAHGYATGTGSSIQASGEGANALGATQLAGDLLASGDGALTTGAAIGATIGASGNGALAGGYSIFQAITSSGLGNIAYGYATGTPIVASGASNCVQFGLGTNSQPNSLQVGDTTDGIRLTAGGAPTTPHDGDIWVDGSGDVNISSSGGGATAVVFNLPNITGSRGGNAALADLLTKLALMNLITDGTT